MLAGLVTHDIVAIGVGLAQGEFLGGVAPHKTISSMLHALIYRISARHICTLAREWLWHSKCHNRSQPRRWIAVTVSRWIDVTISKLKWWAINNYIDTAHAGEYAAKDLAPGSAAATLHPPMLPTG